MGSDLPTNRAYAIASYQLTPPTGWCASPAGNSPASHPAGPVRPVRSVMSAIAASHPISRPFRTIGAGHSSRRR